MHVFYLHGFASSPESAKAKFLAGRLAQRGLRLETPDFNQPDFSTLTVSRMLQQMEKRIAALPQGEVAIIGSSLGAFVGVEIAARQVSEARHPVTRVVLLAPALHLDWERWPEVGPGGIDRWRKHGSIDVFHYAYEEPRPLHFSFYEDAIRYHPAQRQLPQPTVIVQGRRDESVNPASVQQFATAQPRATLHLVDDDHQLKSSLDLIWRETANALSLSSEL